MSKKGKKVQVSGENNLKVDLWGNLSQGDVSSENSPLKSSL